MAMIPENPVVGGTVLRRAAIQSPNFVTGATGWSVNQDGSAEFNNLVIRNGQIISGVALFYSSTPPALGNLIASVAALGGTDTAGNNYLPGVTNYFNGPTPTAVQFVAGQLQFSTAATFAGPWTTGVAISVSIGAGGIASILNIFPQGLVANAITNILGALNVNGGLLTALNGAQVNNGLTADTLTWTAGATGDKITLSRNGGAPLLDITDLANASTAVIRVTVPNGTQQQIALSELVSGDANGRLVLDLNSTGNGRLRCGPGSVAADTNIYRSAANLWASDYIAFDAGSNVAEAWNAVTFANGWANAGLEPGLQYRRVAAPDNCVQIVGSITVPAGFVPGQNITTALPAAYRPAKTNELTVYNANTNAPARIIVLGAGQIQYQAGGNAAGNTLVIPAGNLVALTA